MKKPTINFTSGTNATSEFVNGGSHASKSSTKSVRKQLERIIERTVSQKIDITDGYQNFFNVGMALVNTFGEEGRQHFHALSQFYPGYSYAETDAKYTNLLQSSNGEISAKTLIMIAKDHGINTSNIEESVASRIISFLADNYRFRENIRTSRVEFTSPDDVDGAHWQPITEKAFDTIFTEVISEVKRISRGDLRAIIRSEKVARGYDPLADYFASLGPYSDAMRSAIDDIFNHFILADDEDRDLCRLMFRKWFINMTARWLKGDTETQAILVLVGSQFAGKTYILQHILPPCLRQYSDVVLPNEDFRDKDRKLTLSEKLLLVFDEWAISHKLSNVIKSITSLGQTSIRDSYAQFRENRPCIAAFCMTSNESTPLSTREGNRRYLTMHIKGTLNLNEHPLPYDAAYAEAVHIINSDEDYHFTKDEISLISAHNEQFTEPSPCEEAIRKYYRIPTDREFGVSVGTAEIIESIRMAVPAHDLTPSNIGRAMRHLGFRCYPSGGYSKYYVFELSGSDISKQKSDEGKEIYNQLKASPATIVTDATNIPVTDATNIPVTDATAPFEDDPFEDAPFEDDPLF